MAIIKSYTDLGGGATFTLKYDDVAMELVGVDVSNLSERDITFKLISPKTLTQIFKAGTVASFSIPQDKRSKYSLREVTSVEYGTEYRISGIEWLVGMRN